MGCKLYCLYVRSRDMTAAWNKRGLERTDGGTAEAEKVT